MTKHMNMDSLADALHSFNDAMEKYQNPPTGWQDIARDSVIQRFEYTYELSWKSLQKVLIEIHGIADMHQQSKRDLFREAKQRGLIDTIESWFNYHTARNETSHTYDVDVANKVMHSIADFSEQMAFTLKKLQDATGSNDTSGR